MQRDGLFADFSEWFWRRLTIYVDRPLAPLSPPSVAIKNRGIQEDVTVNVVNTIFAAQRHRDV